MLEQCPNCQKPLNLSEAQQQKIKDALTRLTPGSNLKLGCPQCRKPIELRADGTAVTPAEKRTPAAPPKPTGEGPEPPPPPNLDWLKSGEFEEKDVVGEIPIALILMPEGPGRDAVAKAFTELGFKPEYHSSATEAIEAMKFGSYAAVVLHSRFEGGGLAESSFHKHMRNLAMNRRRLIFYMLTGPEFNTLYDLQALSNSANVVVNDNECNHTDVILKKAIPDYERLFNSLIEALVKEGKMSGGAWSEIQRKGKLDSAVLKDLLEVK